MTNEERLQERREGQEEGRKERDMEIVKNLFKESMSITFISKITGLSEQEIEFLKLE